MPCSRKLLRPCHTLLHPHPLHGPQHPACPQAPLPLSASATGNCARPNTAWHTGVCVSGHPCVLWQRLVTFSQCPTCVRITWPLSCLCGRGLSDLSTLPYRSCTGRRSSRHSNPQWAGLRTPSTSTPSSRRGHPQVCADHSGPGDQEAGAVDTQHCHLPSVRRLCSGS